ncbi:hypothetical protein CELD12_16760 [Cellulomonas sp. NTE-D12]|nr:hypothetical protein CELD12_16760 [Cellulomonas sp. NTE-D12]
MRALRAPGAKGSLTAAPCQPIRRRTTRVPTAGTLHVTPPVGTAGGLRPQASSPAERDRHMGKWKITQNSTVVRIAASAGTLVAVAVLVGAGYKW